MRKRFRNKEKTKYYYDLFYKLYDDKCMEIPSYWIYKIQHKEYSYANMRRLCIVLKWFLDNYDTTKKFLKVFTYKIRYEARIYNSIEEYKEKYHQEGYTFGVFKGIYMPLYDVKKDIPLNLNTYKEYKIEQFPYYEDGIL